MTKLTFLGLFLATLIALPGCKSLPEVSQEPVRKIEVGWGPEDLVLDTFVVSNRLLISCDDRRNEPGLFSGIVAYDLETGEIDTLERRGEPEEMKFHPHGISLRMVGNQALLLVISHEEEGTTSGKSMKDEPSHPIIAYEVKEDHLIWLKTYQSDLFRSPNSVLVLESGDFYVSNDSYKRHGFLEMALRKKKSQLVFCEAGGDCRVVEEKVAYGNGLAYRDGYLYQGATRGNVVYRYKVSPDGSLTGKVVVCKDLTGADNLRFYGDDILVASHPRPFAFIGHAKDPAKHSPSMVSKFSPQDFDPKTGPILPQVVYFDDGSTISASATGLIVGQKLYVSQVFQPYIVEVDLSGTKR
jgi:hypothetical protein